MWSKLLHMKPCLEGVGPNPKPRTQPSSSEGNVSGRISWSLNDIYSQVMGKEHHGRV